MFLALNANISMYVFINLLDKVRRKRKRDVRGDDNNLRGNCENM